MYHSSCGSGERCFLSCATALRDVGGTSRLRFGIVLMGNGKVPRVDLKRFCSIVLSIGRKLGIALHGRTCKVRKTNSWLWQRYNEFMDRMMGNAH